MTFDRKDRYNTHIKPHLDTIAKWCGQGATDVEIASKLGISASTLSKHRQIHPDLLEAMNSAKELADMKVQAGLYKRACGYEYEEITEKPAVEFIAKKLMSKATAAGINLTLNDLKKAFGEHRVEVCRVKRSVPPDTAAAMAWLTNRRRDEWKHRYEQTLHVNGEASKLLDDAEKREKERQAQEAAHSGVIRLVPPPIEKEG